MTSVMIVSMSNGAMSANVSSASRASRVETTGTKPSGVGFVIQHRGRRDWLRYMSSVSVAWSVISSSSSIGRTYSPIFSATRSGHALAVALL